METDCTGDITFYQLDEQGKKVKHKGKMSELLDRGKYNIFIGPSVDGKHNDVIRLPKGSWDILDVLTQRILMHIPGPIIDIGMGESTEMFARHTFMTETSLHSCDIVMGGMFRLFDEPLHKDHFCFIGKSEDFIKEYNFNFTPSIIFIDGDHNYKTLKKEVDFFLPLLKDTGVMFIHDTFPRAAHQIVPESNGRKPGDVYKVRQELERNPELDVFTWPYSALYVGLTMVMKHKERKDYWLKNGRLV